MATIPISQQGYLNVEDLFNDSTPSSQPIEEFDPTPKTAPSVPDATNPNPSGTESGQGNGQPPSTSNSSGGVVNPKAVNAGTTLKSKLLRPALTSHFVCQFNPPADVVSPDSELVSLSCSEASLPGTTLNTAEAVDKFHGMTEKFAYRRMYDDTAEFTFYVDAKNYDILKLFESWISFPYESNNSGDSRIPFHRFKYKKVYETKVYITKFERDFEFVGDGVKVGAIRAKENRNKRTYTLHNAFPIAVNSMPLSYDSSQLLKCSVSFSYTHYSVDDEVVPTTQKQSQPKPNNPPSVPKPPITTNQGDQINVPLPPVTTDGRTIPPFPGTVSTIA